MKPIFKPLKLYKYISYTCLAGIDVKPKDPRFALCKKTTTKNSGATRNNDFSKTVKKLKGGLGQFVKVNNFDNLRKNRPTLKATF